ncbi:hypothetical protein GWI33_023287 [Rhynchophorus ferrugineus]|uniref:C2H2-type domain-containing protein n=1 Tax=Rhynchophorus ferrugineus TaxID=354439 RepID=A0A834MKL0_RHYFE|nr:hypothetical protein GWI33_023287 [Rhynchophorus ferrugineus]
MGEEEKLILNYIEEEDEQPKKSKKCKYSHKTPKVVDENQNAHIQTDFGNVQIKVESDSDESVLTEEPINSLNGDTDIVIKTEPDDQLHQEFKYESHSESENDVGEKHINKKLKRGASKDLANWSTIKNKLKIKITNNINTKDVDVNGISSSTSSKQLYSCDKCLYVGISRANLERHTLIHLDPADIKWYNCTECPYKTKYEHQLKSHFIVHRNPDEINFFQCPHCNLKCSHREYSFTCAECDYKTFSKERLAAHIKKHSKQVFKCELCKFITKHDKYLQSHIKLVHMDVEKPFLCDTCSYKGKTKRELDKHYDRMHKKEKQNIFQCCHCFTKFICGHCDKHFIYKNGLKTHIIRCHIRLPEEEYHKCLKCNYKSKCLNTLKRHIKRNHGAPRLHCEKCSFKTNRQISMDAHMKTHDCDESSILKCPDCPYRILQMTSFLYHVRVVHKKQLSAKEATKYQNCNDN